MTDANVILWGRRIGAVSWDETRSLGVFQYDPAFAGAGIEVDTSDDARQRNTL